MSNQTIAVNEHKPTKVSKKYRLRVCEKLMLDGKSRPDIVRYYKEHFNKGYRTAYRDINEVIESWAAEYEEQRRTRIYKHMRSLEYLYERALKRGNLALARKIRVDIAKLDGSWKERVEHSGHITKTQVIKFGDVEVEF